VTSRPRRVACSNAGWLRLSLIAILFPVLCAYCQPDAAHKKLKPKQPYAIIAGTVWGPDDRPVYGVRVRIRRSQDKKAKWDLQSDHSGEFAQRLPAGTADYVVWADLKGVKSLDGKPLHLLREVPVHVDNDERLDIGLHLTK
jgi:hypothetical protein